MASERTEKTLTAGGATLGSTVNGSGSGAVLIQGVGVAGSGWSPQVEALAGRFRTI